MSPERQRGGEITAIKIRKGRPDRVVVYIDGSGGPELAATVVQGAGLRVGLVLSTEDLDLLEDQDRPHLARSRALATLATRDRSVSEMEARLAQAGFTDGVIGETLQWLTGLGYLDDRRYAERYSAEKLKTGWGERRIRVELARRGVDRTLVDEVLLQLGGDDEAVAEREGALLRLLQRRFGPQFVSDPKAAERKLIGFMARRGYGWDDIDRVVQQLRSREDPDESEAWQSEP